MNTFHSGTDDGDIHMNTAKFPMFLSLIVNYACTTDCKLAIAIETQQTVITYLKWKLKGLKEPIKDLKKVKTTPSSVFVIKCDVVYEQEEWFVDQMCTLRDKPKTTSYAYTPYKASTTPTLPSQTTPATGVTKPIYRKMIDGLPDLLSLGFGGDVIPYQILLKVNSDLQPSEVKDYSKALKYYFKEEWFNENYFYTNAEPVEVIDLILQFLDNHKSIWVVIQLKDIFNELKTECQQLRKV